MARLSSKYQRYKRLVAVGIWYACCIPAGVRKRKQNILLITGNDDTYRQVLLESQGYSVTPAQGADALSAMQGNEFHLILVASYAGLSNETEFCHQVRRHHPNVRIGVLAQRGERVPLESCADMVIHAQYSPAAFLGAINTLLMHEKHSS